MESSDDEFDALPQCVSDYFFEDEHREPTSFSMLPLRWSDDEALNGDNKEMFLSGFVDNGLQKIYKPVTAWKFNLSNALPEISVLFKENSWIKLQKPKKTYEEGRSILVTIRCLHFLKKNPETSEKSLWDYLAKNFSSYDIRPNQNDLADHMHLIGEAVKRDETLGNSKLLISFLVDKPQKLKEHDKVVQTDFIVGDDEEIGIDENESDEEDDLFGYVCAFCDNGGELLCCDGRCFRSFHATEKDGEESQCQSLGFTAKQVKAIDSYVCMNCQYKKHQCFCCGKLGSSDKSSGAEVLVCNSATCGLFYHSHCVSKCLHRDNEVAAKELREKIDAGESFTCPIHKCYVCKAGENKEDRELQFAMCRRCPKSYHRKCLPREISFQDSDNEDSVQRAWDDLLPNRILIYCLDHEIDDVLCTPIRDHIKFPATQEKNKLVSKMHPSKDKFKKKCLPVENSVHESTPTNGSKQVEKSQSMKKVDSFKKIEKRLFATNSFKRTKLNGGPSKPLHDNKKSVSKKLNSSVGEFGTSLGEKLFDYFHDGSEKPKLQRPVSPTSDKSQLTTSYSSVQLDAESEKSLLELIYETNSSITMDKIIKKHKNPSTYSCTTKNAFDKAITQGKIEGSVEAVQAALQMLEQGCSIEDAKAVCGPEVLQHMIRWKNKLRVYLAPFLHGMRYTSFGRHFTKVDKLKEIVDKLHWYVQDGDTIVDFCCGANDFSCLMKSKLEEMGKKCFYKNYDILQPKHDFNFEKRDWMTVQPRELPKGSQLIMGLNPPFGVKASLANQFIDKALQFKPKLLIFIVPPETQRLDKKKSPYDLIWEDDQNLSGKAFYLPGSTDLKDKQMDQWNLTPPVLSLWSRSDWTAANSIIAQNHGHVKSKDESHSEVPVTCLVVDNPKLDSEVSMPKEETFKQIPMEINNPEPVDVKTFGSPAPNEKSPIINVATHKPQDHSDEKRTETRPSKNSKKRSCGKNGYRKPEQNRSADEPKKGNGKRTSPNEMSGRRSSQPRDETSYMGVRNEGYSNLLPNSFGTSVNFAPMDTSVCYHDPLMGMDPRFMGTDPSRGYGPYTTGSRDAEFMSHVHPGQPRAFSHMGHDPIRGYTHMGHIPQSYGFQVPHVDSMSFDRLNTVLQRYAPRLDEMNHRMGPRNGGPFEAQPTQGRFHHMGFAQGPYHPYSHNGSSGWLDE